MLIPGHVGFTLGLATLVQKVRRQPSLDLRRLSLFAFASLLPDILDKSLHWLRPVYPDHLIFHSLVFYAAAMLVLWRIRSQLLVYLGIMTLHPVLDFANTDSRDLFWPVSGWMDWRAGRPLVEPLMHRLPPFLSIKFCSGHYRVFEVVGLALIVWAVWEATRASGRLTGDSERQ